jgi:hypothetical protein
MNEKRNRVFGFAIALSLAIVIVLAGSETAQAYATADSFQNPLNNYQATEYRFGQYLWSGLYHSGEDLRAYTYEPVYAIANGKVVESRWHSGYNQTVVIEHRLPDGSKVCSIYGHLSKVKGGMPKEGKEVRKGQRIGYIGNTNENGDGGPHLHFGIRKGADTGSWRYQGRVSKSQLSKYHKPSDYLNLIRATGSNDVYRLWNLVSKSKVYSPNVFNSWGWNWADVRPVTTTELNRHSNGYPNPLGFKDGTFIKLSNNPEISIISSHIRYPFGSWNAYLRYVGKPDLSNVMMVTYNEYHYLHQKGGTLY